MNQTISIPSINIEIPKIPEMSNLAQVSFIFIIVTFSFLVIFIYRKMHKGKSNNTSDDADIQSKGIDLRKGQYSIDYLERLIKEKYNYYMYLELLPIYLDRKIPEKNVIRDVKEKIYVSVVGSITRQVKEEILTFFTEKGIEIFVHEKIVILINETDFRSAEKFTEAFREINLGNVDKLV